MAIIKSKQSNEQLQATHSSLEVAGERKPMGTLADWEEQQRRKHDAEARRRRRHARVSLEGAGYISIQTTTCCSKRELRTQGAFR